MASMRAWVVETPAPLAARPLQLVEMPRPQPGIGEILVRVRACGVCRTDLHVVEGDLRKRRKRVVPGHQVVGTVEEHGAGAAVPAIGARVGVAWVHRTCGVCRFCASRRENLCETAEFTGWTRDGGFAEFVVVPADFAHVLPDGFDDLQAAPLLCAGIIGYRSLCLTGLAAGDALLGSRLGLYGFGAAGHVVIQLARARGAEVFVMTRDRERHQSLAGELGAAWVGDARQQPPHPLDAAIIFAPAGELVPPALAALDRGGTLVLAGIHMTPIPSITYDVLYQERVVRSVANNTRDDARAFLREAARVPVRTHVREYAFEEADRALADLSGDAIRGAAVLRVGSP